jgi:hypothetical protein
VEKKTGLDGNRTLIHSGFLAWCNDGSTFEQDISAAKLLVRPSKNNGRSSDKGVQELQNPSQIPVYPRWRLADRKETSSFGAGTVENQ